MMELQYFHTVGLHDDIRDMIGASDVCLKDISIVSLHSSGPSGPHINTSAFHVLTYLSRNRTELTILGLH